MNKYHFNIKLPIGFTHYMEEFTTFNQIDLNKRDIDKEFIDWLNSLGVSFASGLFFNSLPNMDYELHVDGNKITDCIKLNVIFDSSDTIMNWYEPQEGYSGIINKNFQNDDILWWEKDRCNLVYSASVNSSCILNAGVVHDLHNGHNDGKIRKCYSLILIDNKTKRRLTWKEALEIFSDFRYD